jgi:hypothetical protein
LNNTAFLGSLFFSILSTCFLFIILYTFILSIFYCESRGWRNGYHACHGTQVSRVRTQLRRWIFKGFKNLQHDFGGKLKPSAPVRNILRHVKNHCKVLTKIFQRPN